MFKVVLDQLRISEGCVRCGHCCEVFDALRHILTQAPDSHKRVVAALSQTNSAANIHLTDSVPATVKDDELLTSKSDGFQDVATAVNSFSDISVSSASIIENEPVIIANSDAELLLGISNEIPLFLQSLTHESTWVSRLWRLMLRMFTLLLVLTLLAQYMYQEHDRLAAFRTEMKPVLHWLCEPLGCRLSPLRSIESIVIESATFTKIGQDGFQLSFVVKNTASIDLALPDVELTLTDLTDETILRRILTPNELRATSETLPAHSEWVVTTALQVKPDSEIISILGYRLVAFYI